MQMSLSDLALLIVDVQPDFLPPNGALPCPSGRSILPVLHELLLSPSSSSYADRRHPTPTPTPTPPAKIKTILFDWNSVICSKDFHPPQHVSFASSHASAGSSDRKRPEPFTTIKMKGRKKVIQIRRERNGEGTGNEDKDEVLDDELLMFDDSIEDDEYIDLSLWPDHCVQGTPGAEIEPSLQEDLEAWLNSCSSTHLDRKLVIVEKGTHPYHEAFSAFAGTRLIRRSSSSSSAAPNSNNIHNPNDDQETLSTYLQERGITRLVVTGLATDYCVFHSAMSALAVPTLREVIVLESAMKGVKEESSQEALKKLREAGAVVLENVQELDKWCAS